MSLLKTIRPLNFLVQHRIRNNGFRQMSSGSEKLTSLQVNESTGIAILSMNRLPVNGLNLELLAEIRDALEQLESNKSRGLILTSGSKTVFSAGLDILEMYKPKKERVTEYWKTLQDVWLKLYGSNFPTAAAINGHSPAGGCLLALCCEYRVMCPNFTIGLNETKLGIVAPKWFQASMRNVIPTRIAESALTLGKMFTTDEALKIGLIDEVAKDKAEAIDKCNKFLMQFQKISPTARAMTKQVFRSKDILDLEDNRDQDLQQFLFIVNQPQVQKGLELYLESLKKKQ